MARVERDIRLKDELPDVEIPGFGYGRRELAVIDKLFRPDIPDGELLNIYFLVHDWNMAGSDVFTPSLKQIEDVVVGRMSGDQAEADEEGALPGFEPEQYREAIEAVCAGNLSHWQLLELYAVAEAGRGDEEIGHRWQSVMDLCRAQILRRMRQARLKRTRHRDDEIPPPPAHTAAEIEARHHANEEYGRRISAEREKVRMSEGGVAEAICLTEREIHRAQEGDPPLDARLILTPLLLTADHWPPHEHIDHLTSKTWVAQYYEAIRRMTPTVREVWLLNKADGLTIAEIAEWQNLSTSMISHRLRQAQMTVERFGPQPPKPPRHKRRGPKR